MSTQKIDPLLQQVLEQVEGSFNEDICNGLSSKYISDLPEYLSSVIKEAVSTLPKIIPFEYLGYRRLTPIEDFYNDISASATKDVVDISTNYLYKVEYLFVYNGLELRRAISLLYTDRGDHFKLSDTDFTLNPVVSEYPIAPNSSEIFLRLLRDKINVKSKNINININRIKTGVKIIYSKSYKLIDGVNDVIPIAIYGFIKYGFYGLMKHKFNTVPLVFVDTVLTTPDKEGYTRYSSTGLKPKALNVTNYKGHDVIIFIKNEDVSSLLETYLASIFACFDYVPLHANNFRKALLKTKEPNTNIDFDNIDKETLFWITILGKVVFKHNFTIDRVQADMIEHISILNGYLDSIIRSRLVDIGVDVEDFYELLLWSIDNFDVARMRSDVNNMSNRYVDLPYYVMFKLIVGVNKAFLELKREGVKKTLTSKEIQRLFNKYMSTKKIFSIVKSSSVNLAVTHLSYTGDNMLLGLTSTLEHQGRGSGVNKSKNNVFPASMKKPNGEEIFVGSMLFLRKVAPTPLLVINPTVMIDPNTDRFVYTEDDKITIKAIDEVISSTFINDTITAEEVIPTDIDDIT